MRQALATRIRQKASLFGAVLLLAGLVAPGVLPVFASAATITNRSIALSTSAKSATAVQYTVTFDAGSAYTLKGVIVDFCSNSSVIGDTCSGTVGEGVPDLGSSPVVSGVKIGDDTEAESGWTAGQLNSDRTLTLNSSTGKAVASGDTVTFDITGVTNPSTGGTNGTFYARIYTYAAATPSGYTAADPGSYSDSGSVALAVVDEVSVNATVPETLTFCVADTAPTTGCGGTLSAPDITLGTGTPVLLDSSAVYTDSTTYIQVSTNAANGASIRMRNGNDCAGLSRDGGAHCDIPGVGGTSPVTMSAGTAGFGLFVGAGTAASGTGTTAGDLNAISPYNESGKYGMSDDSSTGVNSPFGSVIANSAGAPVANMNAQLTFAAAANIATPAGQYTAKITLIATGTY